MLASEGIKVLEKLGDTYVNSPMFQSLSRIGRYIC